jgi:negative regulator of flagellin synthesis FlgM
VTINPTTSSPANRPERSPHGTRAARADSPPSAQTNPADAITISPEGRRVIELSQDQRDRAELVARLRSEVESGTYRPDPEAVARRIAEQIDR